MPEKTCCSDVLLRCKMRDHTFKQKQAVSIYDTPNKLTLRIVAPDLKVGIFQHAR